MAAEWGNSLTNHRAPRRRATLRVSAKPKILSVKFRLWKTGCQHSSRLNLTAEKLCRSENSAALPWVFGWDCRKCRRLKATARRCSSCRFLYRHAPGPFASAAKLRMHPSSRSSESCGIALVREAYTFIYFPSTGAALVSKNRRILTVRVDSGALRTWFRQGKPPCSGERETDFENRSLGPTSPPDTRRGFGCSGKRR